LKRAVLEAPGRLVVVTDERPTAGPGQVVVEVASCGICGSDLHAFNGEHPLVIYPVTPGHEFSGTIAETGEGVDPGLAGRQVCVEPSLFCGGCLQCLSGRYNICSSLRVMGFQAPGAMCEFISVPRDRLHFLPPGVGLVDGALAEPAAVGVHAVSRSGIGSGDNVLIVGAGVIGLMVLKVAQALGCEAVVVESTPERALRAVDFGAVRAVSFDQLGQGEVPSAPGDGSFAAVFECVGRPETIDLALRAAPRGGTIIVVGVPPGPVPVPVPLIQDGELEVRGTLMYRGEDFERALELLESGAIKPDGFVTHHVSLDEVESGYRLMSDPGAKALKVLVDIGGGA